MNEVTLCVNSFSSKFIKISPLWLRDCIDFYKQGDVGLNSTQEDLEKFVYMQWVLFDLREVDVPVLPPNINEEKKYELKETITLQLLSVVDISRSKYSQIQKIRHKLEKPLESDANEFIEFKGDSKRCLQLNLTDGVQEIQAFEYKPMNNLNLGLKPGMKIRFIPPLIVRYGQIMLRNEGEILLLGGEVEELLISNAPENVLAAALNLPLNNNPVLMDDNLKPKSLNVKSKQQMSMKNYLNKVPPAKKITANTDRVQQPFDEDIDYMLDLEDEMKNDVKKPKKLKTLSGETSNKPNLDVSFGISKDLTSKLAQRTSPNTEDLSDVIKKYAPFKSPAKVIEINSSPVKPAKKIAAKTEEEEFELLMEIENDLYGDQNNKTNPVKLREVKAKPSANRVQQPFDEDVDYMLDLEDEMKNNTSSINIANKPKKFKTLSGETSNKPNLDVSFGISNNVTPKLAQRTSPNTEDLAGIIKKYAPFKSPAKVIEIHSSPDNESPKQKPNLRAGTSRQIFQEPSVKCVPLSTLSKSPITTGKFKVNAKFKKVIQKLTFKEDSWCIKLQIEDSSGCLDVAVDCDLIERIMGCSTQQMRGYAQNGVDKFKQALDTFKSKMQSLDGVLEIAFANKVPRLLNIL